MKREVVSETPPPSGNPTGEDDLSSFVTVEGIHINLPRPAADKSPAPHGDGNRGGRCFPVRITVRLIYPSPTYTNRLSFLRSVLGYKTAYEFRLRRGDDSSGGPSGVETANWLVDLMNVTYSLRGVEVVNWLVDHMNLTFSLSGVKLLWNGFSETDDGYRVPVIDWKTVSVTNDDGCDTPVADWDNMTVLIHEFLRNVTAEENRGCGVNDLRITKYVILPEEERKAIIKRRNRDGVGRKWEDSVFGLPQRVMELRMKVVVEKAIERVTMEDCGGGEGAVTCGICLAGLWDGSVVAGLAGCLHRFHERCIVEWLVHNMSCPFCRRPIGISAAGDAPAAVPNNG